MGTVRAMTHIKRPLLADGHVTTKSDGRRTKMSSTIPKKKIRKPTSSALPRPRRPVSYDLPKHLRQFLDESVSEGSASTSARSADTMVARSFRGESVEPTIRLGRVKTMLDLIHRRSKNQHRNQPFFKWLNLTRRAVAQLIDLCVAYHDVGQKSLQLEDRHATAQVVPALSSKANRTLSKAEEVRRKFERQSDIRSQQELHEEWIRETLVPGAYVAFSSLVADTQFANLAVVLMGLLSDITSIIGVPQRIDRPSDASTKRRTLHLTSGAVSVTGTSTVITGSEAGEVVERVYDSEGGKGIIKSDEIGRDGDLGVPVQRSELDEEVTAGDSTWTGKHSRQIDVGTKTAEKDLSRRRRHKQISTPTETKNIRSSHLEFDQDEKPGTTMENPASTRAELRGIQEIPRIIRGDINIPDPNPTKEVKSSSPSAQFDTNNKTQHLPLPKHKIKKQEPGTSDKNREGNGKGKSKGKSKRNAIDDLFSGFV